jgi:hypothetical protein
VAEWPVTQYSIDAADRFVSLNDTWIKQAKSDGRSE